MPALQIDCIRKEFGTLVAVDGLSLDVEAGQVIGLIGPNGAGKTTLLRMLATVLRPTSGTAKILGSELTKEYLEIRRHIGYLPDFFNLYNDLKLAECIAFFARAYGVESGDVPERVTDALRYVELEHKRDDFVRNLSRGMVQRLGVAVLIVHDPQLFILDEPASGLDPKARIQLREVLKRLGREGRTVIISSHILTELAGMCTHVAIMNEGRLVVHGSVDEVERRVTGTRKAVVAVLGDVAAAAAHVKSFEGAELLAVAENTTTVQTSESPDQLADLNAFLVGHGVRIAGLMEQKSSLEDVFMQVSAAGAADDGVGNES